MKRTSGLDRQIPLLHWLTNYNTDTFLRDLLGAVIVSFMFLPQSLAYALLAGLPVEAGVYAAIVPLLGYAVFGTSRVLAVGPVAVIALLTASALTPLATPGTPEYTGLALALAMLSGLILLLMGVFRLGFLSNFLSHPVISGFVSASALLIALSQIKTLLGIPAHGTTLIDLAPQIWAGLGKTVPQTLAIGLAAIAFLYAMRLGMERLLLRAGLPQKPASMLARTGPLAAAIIFTAISYVSDLPAQGVATVGTLPGGMPPLTMPTLDFSILRLLVLPALFISIIGFVESVSVARTFAAKRRESIVPDKELLGLGSANIIASLFGGMPVSGGFSRSIVNSDAGVQTPVASIFTGIGIALVIIFLIPVIALVPQAVLAATIIVAAISLIDLRMLRQTWVFSKSDFVAALTTIVITLLEGPEVGVGVGVVLSLLMYVYRTSRPHIAVVGLVPGTQHFRSIKRYETLTSPTVLSVRMDENLYFANASFLDERLTELLLEKPEVKHLVLMCSGINVIDSSALETLEQLNLRLKDMDVAMHLSEVKGPVIDQLRRTHFLEELSGKVFLTQFQALTELDPAILKR